ncbi:MAG: outer membrane protein assembly factor BamD [Bacteroidales bacterium]|nr:outer membrane protein assembly factor BamD [Bacteroidales bacterium]
MKSKHLLHFCVVMMAGFILASCTSAFDKILKSNNPELKYQKALEYYNLKKYSRAATLFDNVALNFRGTARDDSVNFFLAKSFFLDGDMYSAEHYLNIFRQTFPRSKFTEEAYFLRCVSVYNTTYRASLDPRPSSQALAYMGEFIYLYPSTEWLPEVKKMQEELSARLDEKAFNSAALYYKIEEYKAAVMALKTTLKDNADTRYREDILYLILASSYELARNSVPSRQRDRFQAVIDEYYNVISEYPESKYKKSADSMHAEALRFLEKK